MATAALVSILRGSPFGLAPQDEAAFEARPSGSHLRMTPRKNCTRTRENANVDLDGNARGRRVSPLHGLARLRGKPDDLAVARGDDQSGVRVVICRSPKLT
jgi:hypothetical protein